MARNNGATLLFMSSQKGHQEVMKLLLASGAKVDQAANDGWTPLSVSSDKGHQEVVDLLLANGKKAHHADEVEAVGGEKEEGKPKREARVCLKCGKTAEKMKRCGGCRSVRYCSEECQLKGWTVHMGSCKTMASARKEGGKKS